MFISQEDVPWSKFESNVEKIRDDDESFPTMDAWIVSFTDPKAIKPLQEYLRGRPTLWEQVQHLKLIRRGVSSSEETIFQVVVGVSPHPPNDLPAGYSTPEQCQIPATPSLTRAQLKMKNELWPTVFTPHLLPAEIKFMEAEVKRITEGLQLAVDEAVRARAIGELSIAGCLLPDQYLDSPLVSHDTRVSTGHPLRHTVMNLVRALADKVLMDTRAPPVVVDPDNNLVIADTDKTTSISRGVDTPSPLQNGEGYQLTGRTLFITHEPCLMCTMALVHSRVKEVFYIFPMAQTGGCGSRALVPELPTINHRFNVWRFKQEKLASTLSSVETIVIPENLDA